jgi:hypothetical protein
LPYRLIPPPIRHHILMTCMWIVIAMILLSPFEYWAIVSWPDSSDYFLQEVDSATKGADGRDYIYVGDDLHVSAYNWRHKLNGNCDISVDRVRQNVGGRFDGKRHIMQHVDQQLNGDGFIRSTSWPLAPVRIPVTADWFDDENADEQEMDIFTSGFYKNCNLLDVIRTHLGFPRVHHDGQWNPEREHTRVVLRRSK